MPDNLTAVLSPCARYRYRLQCDIAERGKIYAYIGINPSTAETDKHDPTTRRLRVFTAKFGGRRFLVGNVFDLRTPDVKELADAPRLWGPLHTIELARIIDNADVIVPMWGDRRKLARHLRAHLDGTLDYIVQYSGGRRPILCFGHTSGGDPVHPLFLRGETELVPLLKRT